MRTNEEVDRIEADAYRSGYKDGYVARQKDEYSKRTINLDRLADEKADKYGEA